MGNLMKIKLLNELRLTLRWIYEWNIAPDHQLYRASFPCTVVWLVLGGAKKVKIGESLYELRQGDVVIIPPLVPRIGYPESDAYGPFHYITLAADIKVGSLEFVKLYPMPKISHISDSDCWARLVGKILRVLHLSDKLLGSLHLASHWERTVTEQAAELSTEQAVNFLNAQGAFYEWFCDLCRVLKPVMPVTPVQTDQRIQNICSYIKQNLDKELSTSDLAKFSFLSQSHLRLLFRKTFGISPTEYIRGVRMTYARELLLNSELRLTDIAAMTGYNDASQFSRNFSKSEGMSPMAYRKQFQAYAR